MSPAFPAESGAAAPLLEKKTSRFAWLEQAYPKKPVALPLTSAEADVLSKQRSADSRRRGYLRALLLLIGAALVFAAFGNGLGFRGGGWSRHASSDVQQYVAAGFHDTSTVTSHLHIVESSGSIHDEYTLQPGHGDVSGSEDAGPYGYTTSARLSAQSGSIDVGVEILEEDDSVEENATKYATLLEAGSHTGSVRVHLHSRPSSSPVHASFRSQSGSIHAFLPRSFAGAFRIRTESGSFEFGGSLRERAVIDSDANGNVIGWIHAADDVQRKDRGAGHPDHEETLTIISESGSVTVTDD